MANGICPSNQVLQAFQLGELPEAALDEVAEHLEHCARCEASVQQLDTAVDSILAALRKPAGDHAPTRPALGSTPLPKPAGPSAGKNLFPFLHPAVQPDEIGRLGGYRVLSLAGHGGMAYVFRAEDVALRRRVALKVIKPDISGDAEGWQRSLREARIMAAIKHDHLVTIYQAGEENGVIYLAMELLEGEPLGQRFDRAGALDLAETLRLAREITSGLAVVHRHGLIHRDIKPQNIWLQAPDDRVKILDFGLARFVNDADLTRPGTILGTPSYMSPEQARGETVDARSDLFSLGAVFYYLCTGQKPIQGEQTMAVLTALATATPPHVQEINPALPPALADLVMQLLAKDRADRPASADEVLRRLEQIEADPNHAATRILPGKMRPGGPARRRRAMAFMLTAAIVAGLAAWWWIPRGEEQLPAAAGVVYLAELQPTEKVHWPFKAFIGKGPPDLPPPLEKEPFKGPPRKPPPSEDTPVQIQGRLSPNGIFMHPPVPPLNGQPASISYPLSRRYARFLAQVSLNDGPQESKEPITFSVHGDGKLLWESKPVRSQADTQPVDVDVQDVEVLKIEVQSPGAVGAHAVWIEPRLTLTGS